MKERMRRKYRENKRGEGKELGEREKLERIVVVERGD